MKVIELNKVATASNDRDAAMLREELKARDLFLINLMSAAGSGKTTLLSRTIQDLKGQVPIGVMEADIASDVDAAAIERLGARSIQVHTGGCCHMDAAMTRASLDAFDAGETRIVFLENVGNLICPAEFDTGAHRKVMILSVPEGDDKPLKYPLMFSVSDLLIINKTDTLPVFDFSFDALSENLNKVNPGLPMIPLCALDGSGFDKWIDYLETEIAAFKGSTGEQ